MDTRHTTDETLTKRALTGDTEAFASLVDRHANALASIAWVKVRHWEDAKDIAQQALFIAHCNLPSLSEPAKFGAWVRGIVMNLARKTLERRTTAQRHMGQLPEPDRSTEPSQLAESRERTRQVMQALDGLDEPRREVAVLHYIEGLKVHDVAGLVQRPLGSVKRMLAEARGRLRKELIEMAREEFEEYGLTDRQRERLAKIGEFPRREPKIEATRLDEEASPVRAAGPCGTFVAMQPGAEAVFGCYDHPQRKLTGVTHVCVEGPIDVAGESTLRLDHIDFEPDGKPEWGWLPHYHVDGDSCAYAAKRYGPIRKDMPLITPGDAAWKEAQPEPQALRLQPGDTLDPPEPTGDFGAEGFCVDESLWRLKIGRRSFHCLRRVGVTTHHRVPWSDSLVTDTATESFYLGDGRCVLFRRYNGMRWSAQNPARASDKPGTYEALAEAGVPSLDAFGQTYWLWYDQIPDYAL